MRSRYSCRQKRDPTFIIPFFPEILYPFDASPLNGDWLLYQIFLRSVKRRETLQALILVPPLLFSNTLQIRVPVKRIRSALSLPSKNDYLYFVDTHGPGNDGYYGYFTRDSTSITIAQFREGIIFRQKVHVHLP